MGTAQLHAPPFSLRLQKKIHSSSSFPAMRARLWRRHSAGSAPVRSARRGIWQPCVARVLLKTLLEGCRAMFPPMVRHGWVDGGGRPKRRTRNRKTSTKLRDRQTASEDRGLQASAPIPSCYFNISVCCLPRHVISDHGIAF